MQRRKFLQQSALAVALMSFYKTNAFGFNASQQLYEFKALRNNVGFFTEQGGTIAWLNSTDGYAVVDAQFPNTAVHVIDALKQLGDKPFKLLLNTHHHGDHTAGNIAFKDLVADVVAHENAQFNQKKGAEKANTLDKQLLPNLTFGAAGWRRSLGNEKISAHHFGAAHTNGDAIYHFENANIAHLGDLVFNKRYPFIDTANGANISNWIKVLDAALKKFDTDTLFIFGHARIATQITGGKAEIIAFRDYLTALLQQVERAIKAGESKEDILKLTAIDGAPDWQGDGIGRSLNAAYLELTMGK